MGSVKLFSNIKTKEDNLSLLSPEFQVTIRERDTNWDFAGIQASQGLHGIHPYPAMMHPLIAKRLIAEFSEPNDLVLDPFVGSGVVGVEASRLNRRFVGYDINPLAILIGKVRSRYISPQILRVRLVEIKKDYMVRKMNSFSLPLVRNINYWFGNEVQKALMKLFFIIEHKTSGRVRDFYKIVFSGCVRMVSLTRPNEFKLFRRADWNHYAPKVWDTFESIAERNICCIEEDGFRISPELQPIFQQFDVRNPFPLQRQSVSLVVTSPPYGDSRTTVAYGQFSRLSLEWMGLKENVDHQSLGGNGWDEIVEDFPSIELGLALKNVRNRDLKRYKESCKFYEELWKTIQNITKTIHRKGTICFVVGNRRVAGIEMPMDKAVADFFEKEGFMHQKTIVRSLSNKRMPIENSPSNTKGEKDTTMRFEYIVICKKQKNL